VERAAKVDLKRETVGYRARLGRFDVVEIPGQAFLAVDGSGDPNTSESYRRSVEDLFSTAYRVKFHSKRELGRDYTVMPLEATWTAADLASFTTGRDKDRWSWTLLNAVPDWIEAPDVERFTAGGVRHRTLLEGVCVQTLHVGSYDDEGPVLARLHGEFLPDNGLVPTGRHHEIYLNDPRRTEPGRLRTILRQPCGPVPVAAC